MSDPISKISGENNYIKSTPNVDNAQISGVGKPSEGKGAVQGEFFSILRESFLKEEPSEIQNNKNIVSLGRTTGNITFGTTIDVKDTELATQEIMKALNDPSTKYVNVKEDPNMAPQYKNGLSYIV